MNSKIKGDLANKYREKSANQSPQAILDWLEMDHHKDLVWTTSYIKDDLGMGNGSFYDSIYRLAAEEKIGFASRTYHDFSASDNDYVRGVRLRVRVLIWNKKNAIHVPPLEDWIDEDSLEQGRLFGADLESMSNEELDELISKAKRLQVARGVDRRYAVLSKEHREKLTSVFARIGITDPVYYAYSDKDISFLTYTAVPDMPIDIVMDNGHGPVRFNCRNLTIFGKALVNATDSMFGSDGEQ